MYMFHSGVIVRQLLDRCPGWIPRSACRGHSLTASGQPSSRVITKGTGLFSTYVRKQAFKRSRVPADLPQSSHMVGTKPAHHICMWLLERSGTDDARCGQLPHCNKPHKPQSQTGGAASASRQFAAVTKTEWDFTQTESHLREGGRYGAVCRLGVVVTRPRDISSLNLNLAGHKHNSRHACHSNTLIFDQTWRAGFNNGCEQQLERWKGIDLYPQVSWDFYGIG